VEERRENFSTGRVVLKRKLPATEVSLCGELYDGEGGVLGAGSYLWPFIAMKVNRDLSAPNGSFENDP
jgi:hypothetical protein